MSVFLHDEVEIEDFVYDEEEEMYFYPCPCGDKFEISKVHNFFKGIINLRLIILLLIFRKN